MKDPHVYARDELKNQFATMRKAAIDAVDRFLFSHNDLVSGTKVRDYCHAYALETAYQGNLGWFHDESEEVDGNTEHRYPRYTLYYAIYSETLREVVSLALNGE
jgi:hypothetical protein